MTQPNESSTEAVKTIMDAVAATGSRRRRRYWIAGALAGVVVIVLVLAGSLRGANDAVRYRTEPVRKGSLVITVSATGNLAATNEVEVGSELSGIIKTMTADYNDTVKKGQPLAYLDDAKYRAAVMKSRAQVASAEASYREAVAIRSAAEKNLARYRRTRELTGGKMPSLETVETSEAEFDRTTAAVASAAAAIDVARATLQSDETDLKKTVIYSPINGIVLSRDVEPGQTVAASLSAPVLYTLAEDLRRMELQVDVDEADVGQVREGQSATFTVDAYPDRTFAATITQVRYGSETTDNVVTYKSVLQVENQDLLLRPGMTATASIVVHKVENTLLVPTAALRFSPAPASGSGEKRSLLERLMPGPPRRRTTRNSGSAAAAKPSPASATAQVWVLEDSRPVPVAVARGASDGVVTAVTADALKPGTPLIVSALAAKG
jgi:HlyD family secretion protein